MGLFDTYRCDRTINLGISLKNMSNALKCANNDDGCMIKYEENEGDSITFTFTDTKRDKTQVRKDETRDDDNRWQSVVVIWC